MLYSDAQYQAPGFPFVRFTRRHQDHWVLGRSLTRDCPAWIPCSLIYVNWYSGPYAKEPPTNYLYYPGIAAGPDLPSAIAAGLEEIIERDATMVWWLNAQPRPTVAQTSDLAAVWQGEPARHGQRAWLIYLDNEFEVPVIAGVVVDSADRLLNIGFAARPDPKQAALKAWSEALTLQEGSRDLLQQESLFSQAVARGMMLDRYHKPWRADRAYLDDFREDFRDVCDLMVQQQIFLDPRAQERVAPWVEDGAFGEIPFEDLPRLDGDDLAAYLRRVESRGYEIFYADVTTRDVRLSGLRVARVVVPGLVPNAPAAFPFLGRRRVQDEAVRLGWRHTALEEGALNYFPMPHA